MGDQRAEHPLKLDRVEAARNFFQRCLDRADQDRETLWVAHLDSAAQCVHLSRHDGQLAELDLPIRAIMADAALHNSSAIVLAHNHPSGDARPSAADCRATRRLAALADAMDCTLLDHLIFAGQDCTSFRRLGLL